MSRDIQVVLEAAIKDITPEVYNTMNRAQRRGLVYGPGCKKRSFRKLINRRINHEQLG